MPFFVRRSAQATAAEAQASHDGPIVVVLRLRGGNDGLNTLVPVRDDRYYRARPTIAIPGPQTIRLDGSDLGLNPWLADVRQLMDDGLAGIVQGVGYPRSSRSHVRATEIWETGSVAARAPEHGWLGRYLDHACECGGEPLAGVQFAESLGRTLASSSSRSMAITHPELLLGMDAPRRSPLRLAVHALLGSTTSSRWPMDSPTPPASSTAPGPGREPASTIPTRRSANPSGGPAT